MADAATLTIELKDKGGPVSSGPPQAPGARAIAGMTPAQVAALPPVPAKAANPAVQAAVDAMEREQLTKRAEVVRRQIDGEYRQRKDAEEKLDNRRKELADQSARAGQQGAVAAGLAGLGIPGAKTAQGVLGGAAAGRQAATSATSLLGGGEAALAAAGPIGAAVGAGIAVVSMVMKKLQEGIETVFKMGGAIASFDPQKLARGFADMAGNVPLVGGLLGGLAHGILDLSDSLDATTRRLAQYNPELAVHMAEREIKNIERDIRRANEFGPQMLETAQARDTMNEKLQEIMDDLMGTLIPIVTELLSWVTDGIKWAVEAWKVLGDWFVDLENVVIDALNWANSTNPFWTNLERLARNMREQARNEEPSADFFSQLLRSADGLAPRNAQLPNGGFRPAVPPIFAW